MRLVFPTNENEGYLSKRDAHFGKAHFYTVITLIDKKITNVEGIKNPGHTDGGCDSAIKNIMGLKPDALIVGGIGGGAAQGFINVGLNVYFDKTSKTVQESLKIFLEGKLEKSSGQGTCNHN